jgi:hypothetical protein
MFINYYYLSLLPFVVAFRKFPLRDIIIGRAVFSTVIDSLSTEVCSAPSVCMAVLNTNDHNPLQLVYVATAIYVVNFVWKENAIKDQEKRLDAFSEYISSRRITNSLLIMWAIIFTKSIDSAF